MSADRTIRLLLVEDNPSDVFLLKSTLSKARAQNFQVIAVERLKDALSVLKENSMDVIVTDLHLPDSVDLETIRQLAKHAGQIPIIALTGLEDPTLGARLIEEGAQCYWSKDRISDPDIADSIAKIIENKAVR